MQRLNFLIILNRYYEQKSAKSPSVDGRTGMKYGHKRASEANNFLEDLATKQGEKLPHKAKVMLPTCVTQKNAYEEYVQSHKQPFCMLSPFPKDMEGAVSRNDGIRGIYIIYFKNQFSFS